MKTCTAILLTGTMTGVFATEAVDLETGLAGAIMNTVYHEPTRAEWTRATELFRSTLEGGWSQADLANQWSELGFEFQKVATPSETLWLLSDPTSHEGGRGWYLFRTPQSSPMALQAPHARNDVHTGVITLRLFLAGQARAMAASTITRHRADLAHLDQTFFQAFTVAFAHACPTGLVVQVHGFEPRKHPGLEAEIIASAGTRFPEPWLTDLVQRFRNNASLRASAYPRDTTQLGGTLNAQGHALRENRHSRFLHLELSSELRERLIGGNAHHQILLESLSAANER